MLGNSDPSNVRPQSENLMGREESLSAPESSSKQDTAKSGGASSVPMPVPDTSSSAEKREINKRILHTKTTKRRLDHGNRLLGAETRRETFRIPQDIPSGVPFTPSEKSFNDRDGEVSGETPATSPDGEISTNGYWSEENSLTAKVAEDLKLIQNMSALTLSQGRQDPRAHAAHEKSDEVIEQSSNGDTRKKIQLLTSRMSDVRAFFQQFTETAQSGKNLALFVSHLYWPLVAQKRSSINDMIPSLSLDESMALKENISRSFDDLKSIVDDISSVNLENLRNSNLVYQSIQLTSKSFTPVNAVVTKKQVFHWVLSRQMGLLRPVCTGRDMHMLHPVDFNCRLTRNFRSYFRIRGSYNVRSRWYFIRACRVLMEKHFRSLKHHKLLHGQPELPVTVPSNYTKQGLGELFVELVHNCEISKWIGALDWANEFNKCIALVLQDYRKKCEDPREIDYLEQAYNYAIDDGTLFRRFRLLEIAGSRDRTENLPAGWQEIRDCSGRQCWTHHEFLFLTYKRPTTAISVSSVKEKRSRKEALIASRIPKKGSSRARTDQTSSTLSGPLQRTKFCDDNQPHEEQDQALAAHHEAGPRPDIIHKSRLLLTALPDITNMVCYFPDESSLQSRTSDHGPLRPNENSATIILKLIEGLQKLKQDHKETEQRKKPGEKSEERK